MENEFDEFSNAINKICYWYYSYSIDNTVNWLNDHKGVWEKYYPSLSQQQLTLLKERAKYNLRLRIFLRPYIFDINWIIEDILTHNPQEYDNSFHWIIEHQNELIKYKKEVDPEFFWRYQKSLRKDRELRKYLGIFLFKPSWMLFDLVNGDIVEKENAALWLKNNREICKNDIDGLCLYEFIDNSVNNPLAWEFYTQVLPELTHHDYLFEKVCLIAEEDINKTKKSILLIFTILPDKTKAWFDLIPQIIPIFNNTNWDGKYYKRPSATLLEAQKNWILAILNEIFYKLNDKVLGFRGFFDFNKMSSPKVRYNSLHFAFLIFSIIPDSDRYESWKVILNFINSDSPLIEIKYKATTLLDSFFKMIPEIDRGKAWQDIEELLKNDDNEIVAKLIDTLGSLFPTIPQEKLISIWKISHNLVTNENPEIRMCVAEASGKFYSNLPVEYQEQVSTDLAILIKDREHVVSASAQYSLGTVNIFHATQSNTVETFQKYLIQAIQNFQSSLETAEFFNQARFCYPFYKAYWSIAFTDNPDIGDIEKNLNSARLEQGNSDTRKNLVKIIRALANAEKNARKNRDFETIKKDFDSYRKYCETAILLMKNTEKDAPLVTQVLMKGLPVIDKKIKKIITDLQTEARDFCKKTRGTQQENLGQETHTLAQNLSQSSDLSQLQVGLNAIIDNINEKICGHLTTLEQREICVLIHQTKEMNELSQKIEGVISIISAVGEKILTTSDLIIGQKTTDTAKIVAVQLNFSLTNQFPPILQNETTVKAKIIKFLTYAKKISTDLIVFPELCVKKEWADDIKRQFPDIVIIFGSYYNNNENTTCVLYDSKIIASQKKIIPSDFEDPKLTGIGMLYGPKTIHTFQAPFGDFSILICRDFGVFHDDLKGKSSLILVPSYNSSIERFYENANVHVTDYPSYILFSNAAQFGGTSFFGQIKKSYFTSLIQKGFKKDTDNSYNLCSIPKNQEGMIIVDLDMKNRSPQVPTPMNPNDEKKNIKFIDIVKIEDIR